MDPAYENAVNAKTAAQCGETPARNYDTCGIMAGKAAYKPPSLREQAEKSVGYHRSEADKHDRAVAFFRENPAFDEFIQLVRSGAIQF
jgi:hypothetical protein